MSKDQALRLALEALKEINKLSVGKNAICLPAEIDTAMDAIEQALAQPVATNDISQDRVDETAKQRHEPEPVACNECKEWEMICDQHLRHIKKLKAKRTWQGLTDEEKSEIYYNQKFVVEFYSPAKFADAIEAKLKEKNT